MPFDHPGGSLDLRLISWSVAGGRAGGAALQCAQRRRVRNVGAKAAARAPGCPCTVADRETVTRSSSLSFSFIIRSAIRKNIGRNRRPEFSQQNTQPFKLPDGMTWQK